MPSSCFCIACAQAVVADNHGGAGNMDMQQLLMERIKKRNDRIRAMSRGMVPSEVPPFMCDRCGADLNTDTETLAIEQWTIGMEKKITQGLRELPRDIFQNADGVNKEEATAGDDADDWVSVN